jgi:hypothetical protein
MHNNAACHNCWYDKRIISLTVCLPPTWHPAGDGHAGALGQCGDAAAAAGVDADGVALVVCATGLNARLLTLVQ